MSRLAPAAQKVFDDARRALGPSHDDARRNFAALAAKLGGAAAIGAAGGAAATATEVATGGVATGGVATGSVAPGAGTAAVSAGAGAAKVAAAGGAATLPTTGAAVGGAATGAAKAGLVATFAKVALPLALVAGAASQAPELARSFRGAPATVATTAAPAAPRPEVGGPAPRGTAIHERDDATILQSARTEPAEAPPTPPASGATPVTAPREVAGRTVRAGARPATPPAPPATAAAPATEPPTAPAPADDLAAELSVVRAMHDASRAGRSAEALGLVAAHARRWPDGRLAEERESVRAVATCATADAAGKAAAADTFRGRFPRSPHLARVERACGAR